MIYFRTAKKTPEAFVAQRVAMVIGQVPREREGDTIPYQKTSMGSDSWQLDNGNDWFLVRHDTSAEGLPIYRLTYRYTTPERQQAMEGLVQFLEWMFGATGD